MLTGEHRVRQIIRLRDIDPLQRATELRGGDLEQISIDNDYGPRVRYLCHLD